MHVPALHVAHGVCYAILAYDVGLSIDLEACAQRITTITQRARISPKHRTPPYFAYRLAPLRLTQEAVALPFGDYGSSTSVDVFLYDFPGALAPSMVSWHADAAASLTPQAPGRRRGGEKGLWNSYPPHTWLRSPSFLRRLANVWYGMRVDRLGRGHPGDSARASPQARRPRRHLAAAASAGKLGEDVLRLRPPARHRAGDPL